MLELLHRCMQRCFLNSHPAKLCCPHPWLEQTGGSCWLPATANPIWVGKMQGDEGEQCGGTEAEGEMCRLKWQSERWSSCASAGCAVQQTLMATAKKLDAYKPQIPRVSNMAGLSAAAQWLGHTGFGSQAVDFTANYFSSLTFWRNEIGTKRFCGSEASVCFLA